MTTGCLFGKSQAMDASGGGSGKRRKPMPDSMEKHFLLRRSQRNPQLGDTYVTAERQS
jgi:hypothetical protein